MDDFEENPLFRKHPSSIYCNWLKGLLQNVVTVGTQPYKPSRKTTGFPVFAVCTFEWPDPGEHSFRSLTVYGRNPKQPPGMYKTL